MSARPPWALAGIGGGIRAAVRDDHSAVAAFLAGMDSDGLYQRHFAHGEAPNQALLNRLAATDGWRRVALLALDPEGRVTGHAEYVAEGDAAEFALMVLPEWRDCGTGGALLDALIDHATRAGLERMHGLIQATNTRAVQVARKRGFRAGPGDDARTVIVSRTLQRPGPIDSDRIASPALLPASHHDLDRIPLHRCPGP